MQAKYGLNPQFPITRYVNGLDLADGPRSDWRVSGERGGLHREQRLHEPALRLVAADRGAALFSERGLARGDLRRDDALQPARREAGAAAGVVFFTRSSAAFRGSSSTSTRPARPTATLTQADWVRILGTDPDTYNYTGIDPHMIESYWPRTGAGDPNNTSGVGGPTGAPTFQTAQLLPALSGAGGTSPAETAPQPPGSGATADPYNGSEFIYEPADHTST